MIASNAVAPSGFNLGSALKRVSAAERGSCDGRLPGNFTKSAGLSPAQAARAAWLAASGLRPCAMRVRVVTLTPVASLTAFHVTLRASTVSASAL